MSRFILSITALSVLSVFSVFSAEARAACVVLDEDRDNLSADEQKAASMLLEQALIAQDIDLEDSVDSGGDCGSTWSVSHVRLGESITVALTGVGDSQSMTVGGLEELPDAYARLISALLNDEEVSDTVTRDTVTDAESEEANRVNVEGLTYLQLGGGGGYNDALSVAGGGVLVGMGYRHEMDRWAVDVGGTLLIPTNEDLRFFHIQGQFQALRFVNEQANNTLYAGAGLGLGGGGGFGLEGSAVLGYEMFRATNIRLFFQGVVTFPMHAYDSWISDTSGGYMPYGGLTLGFAFKPPERKAPTSILQVIF